jgi:hypothetical protein
MPLSPDFTVSIDSSRTTLTVTDATTYGGSNPARNVLLVYFKGFKMDSNNGETDLVLVGNNSNPATNSSWAGTYLTDGWYKFYYAAIPALDITATYNKYDAVYSGAVVYRSKVAANTQDDPTNTTYWEVISDPAELANNEGETNESANITSFIYHRVLAANSQYAYGNFIADQCACSDCDESETLKTYDILSLWIKGLEVADQRTENIKGEYIARRIESKFI